MNCRPPFFGSSLVLLFFAFLGSWEAQTAFAGPDAPSPAATEVFELFFKLGLPESAGAKWVSAACDRGNGGGLPDESTGVSYTGNAWLAREYPDGSVDLVFRQHYVIHARRKSLPGSNAPENPELAILPEAEIQTANLDADLEQFETRIEEHRKRTVDGDKPEFDDAATCIFFLAHLYRQGRVEFATRLLPKVIGLGKKPSAVLDEALALLATRRLVKLNDEWIKGLPANDFANSLETMAADFPRRGSPSRKLALALAQKARAQSPAAGADEAEIKPIAELLLHANAQQIGRVSLTKNWLLPEADDTFLSGRAANLAESGWATPESTLEDNFGIRKDELLADNYFTSLFAGKVKSALALARLLDDHRLLRALDWDTSFHEGSMLSDEEQERLDAEKAEEPVDPGRNGLNDIPHPIDVGKLAWRLLEPILPARLVLNYQSGEKAQTRQIREWLKTIADFSDEELAWNYLETADAATDNNFVLALSFLVHNGGEKTLARLRPVFVDPAVWASFDSFLPTLESFVKRHGDDSAQFRESIREIAKTQRYEPDLSTKVERVLNPRSIGDLLTEAATKSGAESKMLLQAVSHEIQAVAWTEAEPQIYRAAAAASDPGMKSCLLHALLRTGRIRRRKEPATPPSMAALQEPATRPAVEALLDEERVDLPDFNEWHFDNQSVGELTAIAIAQKRLGAADFLPWKELKITSPRIAYRWLVAFARALLAGQDAPPVPDAARVSATRVDSLIEELGALAPMESYQAIRGKSLDEQLAVVKTLTARSSWPPGLQKAQLIVRHVYASSALGFPVEAERWKGRAMDVSLFYDLLAFAERAALAGHSFSIIVGASEPLNGAELLINDYFALSRPDVAAITLPGLGEMPPPAAFSFCTVGRYGVTDKQIGPSYLKPLWRDPQQSEVWQKSHAAASDPKQMLGNQNGKPCSAEPSALEKGIAGLSDGGTEYNWGFSFDILCQVNGDEAVATPR